MAVTLTFCGAAGTVTGLCLLFETPAGRVLVDCGMFQGPKTLKALNHEPFPFAPDSIHAVLLTHAHIDHSGLIPKLVKQGFRGTILATEATIDLCSCLLPDAGSIQEKEVADLNRRNRRRGRAEVEPIYTLADAERALTRFRAVSYSRWETPLKGLRARWWNAGHMLGSSSIELEFDAAPRPIRVLVSGDVGPLVGPMQRDPEGPRDGLDHLIVESTYGDEERPAITPEARRTALAALLRDAASQGGALLIPVFAVERAQEVIVDLVTLMRAGDAPSAPIHLDSPLATRATRVFLRHTASLEDAAAIDDALADARVQPVEDWKASRRLANRAGYQVVLAGSGMCDAGRIRAHLKARLWDARTIVALVGFQAAGTLGRLLQDGAREVRIQGEPINVAARIARIEGYSGHADAAELQRWIEARGPVSGGTFLVHGETDALAGLAARLPRPTLRPMLDEAFRLTPGTAPEALPAAPRRRSAAGLGEPDWHNRRSALLLSIEDALEHAPDDSAREALMRRLRTAMESA